MRLYTYGSSELLQSRLFKLYIRHFDNNNPMKGK